PAASAASTNAFVMNRVGDAGFLLALLVAWQAVGSWELDVLFWKGDRALTGTTGLLFSLGILAGCFGKSAQVPLHTWLPDAMEGPTPVSALIHAATMVAAGVYLAARCLPILSPEGQLILAYTGAITLFLSAAVALVQTDIKRALAFSTCSQLGFMMLAVGLGGWHAGLFHLLTHAFFKALLFLGAGSVIHGMHHEQDMSRMGGLLRKMPVTAITMLIGVFAIIGVPLFSGWYSKDAILALAYGTIELHPERWPLLLLPALTVPMTAYYMLRIWCWTFLGSPRSEAAAHAHESPRLMQLVLVILAIPSVAVAWGWPLGDVSASLLGTFLKSSPIITPSNSIMEAEAAEHHGHSGGMMIGLVGLILGSAVAIIAHRQRLWIGVPRSALGRFLFHRFYWDSAYSTAIITPTQHLASTLATADKAPDGAPRPTLDSLWTRLACLAPNLGNRARQLQSGQPRQYALVMGLTLTLLLGMLWGLRMTR
ncbi:MAG: NADH-quinone oxidoreductase subunit 5 family protein, partial [Gemmataceae bacterium]